MGINVKSIFYDKDNTETNLYRDLLKDAQSTSFIYMDDISYSGIQLKTDMSEFLKVFPDRRLFVMAYALLPAAVGRIYEFLVMAKTNFVRNNLIDAKPDQASLYKKFSTFSPVYKNLSDIFTIMVNQIIVNRAEVLFRIIHNQDPFTLEKQLSRLCFVDDEDEDINEYLTWSPVKNTLFFIDGKELESGVPHLVTSEKFRQESQPRLIKQQLENIHTVVEKTENFLESFPNKQFISYFFQKYGRGPVVVLNYKVPDFFSLNPLYFGLIYDIFLNHTSNNLEYETRSNNTIYYFPLVTDNVKKNESFFKKAWYKNIPIQNIGTQYLI